MKTSLVAAAAMLVLQAAPAHAHRLDEYLQATTISVGKDVVQAQIRMTPGVAVFSNLFAAIDANSDGLISESEQRAYAERVLRDLSLAIDGTRLPLRLVAVKFASLAELKEGRGIIQIDFAAVAPRGGSTRRLTFVNYHQPRIAQYLVNALVPRDSTIRVTGQSRNYEQSSYRMDYSLAGARSGAQPLAWWSGTPAWLALGAFLSLGLLGFTSRRRASRAISRAATGCA
jgi:hypothetical protein